jgi:hypothetical protein
MSGVFRNIEPHPLTARQVFTPQPLVLGEDTLAGWRGGEGPIVRKTPDTALYSIYVSTLCSTVYTLYNIALTEVISIAALGEGSITVALDAQMVFLLDA